MLGKDFKEQLLKYIDASCLEQRFGGNLPNKMSEFFPPDMNISGEVMISQDQYL